jgi:sulfane dehydrogenase subunit SoxC
MSSRGKVDNPEVRQRLAPDSHLAHFFFLIGIACRVRRAYDGTNVPLAGQSLGKDEAMDMLKKTLNPVTSRRRLLKGSVATAGASAAAVLGLVKEAKADHAIPDWLKVPGEVVRGYGQPAATEADVKRALIQLYKDLAPAYSFSGTPLQKLRGTITPNGLHFEVHHGGRPALDPAQHRLMIHGLVDRPLEFDLAALERYPMISRIHFIECAGNTFFNAVFEEPQQLGCDMLHGLVSNSEWTGIPLRVLLEEAGIRKEAKWVVAIGNDAPNIARSIPLENIMGDGILALYQNGERIRPEQGYPMRLVLPGYEGNMNIKWITSLQVSSGPAYTKDESGEYTDILADGKAIEFSFTIGVKSIITHPSGTMSMTGPGLYEISGLAWSGLGKVVRVEVSADGGATWANAELHEPILSRAMTGFSTAWRWDGAPATLMSRAHDEVGYEQPTRADWKKRYSPSNYNHYNAIQAWLITDKGAVQNVYS